TRVYLQKEKEGATFEELETLTLGSLRRAVKEGDVATGTVMSGQIAGMLKDCKPCREIIEDLVREAGAALEQAGDLLR
ncbi:MAG: enoyl-[acyl-carrier-protein] reductase FabK, partial [Lachnospiraceae bacterium]|nr:enoyl-[acyl-carrier-protein] reductase FabK [Lachnospiraceae bacterium]